MEERPLVERSFGSGSALRSLIFFRFFLIKVRMAQSCYICVFLLNLCGLVGGLMRANFCFLSETNLKV